MARKPNRSSRHIPEFFKVLDDVHFSQHLSMPPAYINHFSQLPSKCMLRGRSGKLWKVGLEERHDGLFFHGGWRKFVRDHALDFGNFLVFAYDGHSIFDVKIYDHSYCEKEASQAAIDLDTESSDEEDTQSSDEDTEEEEVDESADEEEREEEELDTCFLGDEDNGVDDLDIEDSKDEEAGTSNKRKSGSIRSGKRPATVKAKEASLAKEKKAKETSNTHVVFTSKHLCFAATYMRNQYRMQIPKVIAVAAGLESKKSVKLEDLAGRLWIVTLRQNDRLLMTVGWLQCYRANNIAVGDTVVFELVKEDFMKIHVFKGDAKGRRCSLVLNCPRP